MKAEQTNRLIEKAGGKFISNNDMLNDIYSLDELPNKFKSIIDMSQVIVMSTEMELFNDESDVYFYDKNGEQFVIGLTKAEIRNIKKEALNIIMEGLALKEIGDDIEEKEIEFFNTGKFKDMLKYTKKNKKSKSKKGDDRGPEDISPDDVSNSEDEISIVESEVVEAQLVTPEDVSEMYQEDTSMNY